jgi:cytochrome c-type biogenesis protein
VGAFLGSALMLASREGSALTGMVMLLSYSAGLGVPFLISAVCIDYLKSTFDGIKKHYTLVSRICGIFLVAVGVLMATGLFGRMLNLLA